MKVKIINYKEFKITQAEAIEFDVEDFRKCEPPYEGNSEEDFAEYISTFNDEYFEENDEVIEKYDLDIFFNFESDHNIVYEDEYPEENMVLVNPDTWDETMYDNAKSENCKSINYR